MSGVLRPGVTRYLLLLNGLAVVGAVMNHALGWGFTALFWWTDRYDPGPVPNFSGIGSTSYYGLRAVEQLVAPSLPVFLFVSGFFVAFAAGREATIGWEKIRARVRMLLIPYVLWSGAILAGKALEGQTDSAGGYVEQIIFGRAAIPYYYIPLLTQLYLLSPPLVRWMRAHWRAALVAAATVQFAIQATRYPVLLGWDVPAVSWVGRHAPGWFFPTMAFWFVLGVSAGLNGPAFRQLLARWRAHLPWLALLLGVLGFLEWEALFAASSKTWLNPAPTVLDSLFSGVMILAFLAHAEKWHFGRRRFDTLGERSFGIYLIHAPVLELLSRAIYHTVPMVLAHQLVFQILLVAAGIGVPLLMMAAIRRSPARPCYNYLFG